MDQHSFSLQKYAGTRSRYECPACGQKRCFTRYVDENGDFLSEEVGRCDHESSCGYHYTPKDYFRDHPDAKSGHDWRELTYEERQRLLPTKKPQQPLCTIPQEFVTRSVRPSVHSSLTQFLATKIDPLVLECVICEYQVGVTKDRSAIFFQIDSHGRCRSGKVMKYDSSTGHRIKDERIPKAITWIHTLLKKSGVLPDTWTMTQCLFGEHLLPKYPDRKVALVESEKTAIICAAKIPQYIWVATGGKSQLGDKLAVLRGRDVIAFPDSDAYDEWSQKLVGIPGVSIKISDYLEKNATEADRQAKVDIADLLLHQDSPAAPVKVTPPEDPILKYFAPEHRENVKALIEELDLMPVSITKIG